MGVSVANYSGNLKQNPYPNLAPIDKDTVNFKGQDTVQTKKKRMSGFAKVCLGLLGIGAVAITTYKLKQPQKIQENFQKIFLRDLTKDETSQMHKKYREIYKIKDTDTFLDKMFEQLQKDFKLEKMPLKLDKAYQSGGKVGAITAGSVYSSCYKNANIIHIDKTLEQKLGREKLVGQLTHEMRHARQDLAIYQVGTEKELCEMFEKRIADMFKNDKTYNMKDLHRDARQLYNENRDFFEKAGFSKISKNDRNYEWARKQLKSYAIDANKSESVYSTAFYETDAKEVENIMQQLICHFL